MRVCTLNQSKIVLMFTKTNDNVLVFKKATYIKQNSKTLKHKKISCIITTVNKLHKAHNKKGEFTSVHHAKITFCLNIF